MLSLYIFTLKPIQNSIIYLTLFQFLSIYYLFIMCIVISKMVGKAGLEPATLGLEDRCSIQLSYLPKRAGLSRQLTEVCFTLRGQRPTRRSNLQQSLLHKKHLIVFLDTALRQTGNRSKLGETSLLLAFKDAENL